MIMKTVIPLLISMIIFSVLTAQPKLDDSWIPQAGDTWTQRVSQDRIDPGPAGANVIWDFSEINPSYVFRITFNWVDPSTTPYVDSFPDATIAAVIDGFGESYGYYRKSEDRFEFLGTGDEVFFERYTDPQTFAFFDLGFEETATDQYKVVDYFFDTRDTLSGQTSFTYDGYGTLLLPEAEVSNAIRIHELDVQNDTTGNSFLYTVYSDTLESYAWIANESVFPIVLIQYSSYRSQTYLDGELISEEMEEPEYIFALNPAVMTSSLDNPEVVDQGYELYPRMAQDQLTLNFEEFTSANYQILSITGQKLSAGRINGNPSSIEISHLPPGYHILALEGYPSQTFVKLK